MFTLQIKRSGANAAVALINTYSYGIISVATTEFPLNCRIIRKKYMCPTIAKLRILHQLIFAVCKIPSTTNLQEQPLEIHGLCLPQQLQQCLLLGLLWYFPFNYVLKSILAPFLLPLPCTQRMDNRESNLQPKSRLCQEQSIPKIIFTIIYMQLTYLKRISGLPSMTLRIYLNYSYNLYIVTRDRILADYSPRVC